MYVARALIARRCNHRFQNHRLIDCFFDAPLVTENRFSIVLISEGFSACLQRVASSVFAPSSLRLRLPLASLPGAESTQRMERGAGEAGPRDHGPRTTGIMEARRYAYEDSTAVCEAVGCKDDPSKSDEEALRRQGSCSLLDAPGACMKRPVPGRTRLQPRKGRDQRCRQKRRRGQRDSRRENTRRQDDPQPIQRGRFPGNLPRNMVALAAA